MFFFSRWRQKRTQSWVEWSRDTWDFFYFLIFILRNDLRSQIKHQCKGLCLLIVVTVKWGSSKEKPGENTERDKRGNITWISRVPIYLFSLLNCNKAKTAPTVFQLLSSKAVTSAGLRGVWGSSQQFDMPHLAPSSYPLPADPQFPSAGGPKPCPQTISTHKWHLFPGWVCQISLFPMCLQAWTLKGGVFLYGMWSV